MATREIEASYEVFEASIIQGASSGAVTADADEQGYLLSNGTNRSLAAGVTPEGEILIYLQTNGYDAILQDDIDEAAQWFLAMGDEGGAVEESERARILQGAHRTIDFCDYLDGIFRAEEAAEQIDWYRDGARAAMERVGA